MPVITVSICTFDRYDLLPQALASVARQSLAHEQYRILVVDNTGHDRPCGAQEYARTIPNLTYLTTATPGLSNARNIAARECGTEFIAFMDDDARADPRWVEEILKALRAFGPRTEVVGGRVDAVWGAPRPPWLHEVLLGRVSVVNWGPRTRIATRLEGFAGTNIAFRTQSILEHGGFAVHLGRIGAGSALLSNEEVDLAERITASGGLRVYAPLARVEHLVRAERLTQAWFRKRAAWQAVSDFMMDPQRFTGNVANCWRETIGYFNSLSPHERTIRGFLVDTDDPELFLRQTDAIYAMTLMALAGFEGVKRDGQTR